jgi:ADP-ribosyl-[dinitrogen reductase] hydrolase
MKLVDNLDRSMGCFIGLAVGDALGAPLEFSSRRDPSYKEITEYRSGGPFNLQAGQWTDDTSQALCLAETLLIRKGFSQEDFMNRMVNWWTAGYNSSTGKCFDIGTGTQLALWRFVNTGEIATPLSSGGNGSLMRLAAIPIAYQEFPLDVVALKAEDSCRVTHGLPEAILCTRFMSRVLCRLISGESPDDFMNQEVQLLSASSESHQKISKLIQDIKESRTQEEDFYDPTGYCVTSLVAALYCFLSTSSFEECLLKTVNLCGDSDTVGAIAGQLAGSFYGLKQIPEKWVNGLHDNHRLLQIAESLFPITQHSINYGY